MQAALKEHPEWQGDWQMPEGITQAEINPKTGEPATPEDADRRVELFINGTQPAAASSEMEDEATKEEEGEPTPDPEVGTEPTLPSPSPSPHRSPRAETRPGDATRLEGTITLDIDPTTGLIAVETCPVVRTKTFVLGTEPKKYCGPEYHKAKPTDPAATRPRLANPASTPPR
jgi:membrane carboxypeptidase/penicillin-binding protein